MYGHVEKNIRTVFMLFQVEYSVCLQFFFFVHYIFFSRNLYRIVNHIKLCSNNKRIEIIVIVMKVLTFSFSKVFWSILNCQTCMNQNKFLYWYLKCLQMYQGHFCNVCVQSKVGLKLLKCTKPVSYQQIKYDNGPFLRFL